MCGDGWNLHPLFEWIKEESKAISVSRKSRKIKSDRHLEEVTGEEGTAGGVRLISNEQTDERPRPSFIFHFFIHFVFIEPGNW